MDIEGDMARSVIRLLGRDTWTLRVIWLGVWLDY